MRQFHKISTLLQNQYWNRCHGPRMLFWTGLALALLVLASVRAAAGDEEKQKSTTTDDSEAVGAPPYYCGVYSLFRAARGLGREIEFHELLKPEYIGSHQGSSLAELIRAASEQGLQAEPMGRMTCALLCEVDCPVILHVKDDMSQAKEYNHWVLFMGVEDSKARIYDGVKSVELVEFAALSSR